MLVSTSPSCVVEIVVVLLVIVCFGSSVVADGIDAANTFINSDWLNEASEHFATSVDDPFGALNLDATANNFLDRRRRQLASMATTTTSTQNRVPNAIDQGRARFEVSAQHPVYILFPLPKETGPTEINPFGITILKVQPVVAEALDEVYRRQLIPRDAFDLAFEDTQLSDAHGPNVAIHALVQNRLDCIIGYAFVYALAPVARMSPHWKDKDSNGIPVITPIGLTSNLDNRLEYQLMTRISSPYKVVRDNVVALFTTMKWTRTVYLFHDRRAGLMNPTVPYGECYLTMASIEPSLSRFHKMQHNYFMFDETTYNRQVMLDYLKKASLHSNVIILCASPDTVREIMLAAHDLGMATSGEYVFINIDVSTGSHAEKPWIRANDTNSPENEKAKEAYKALKTISLRRSDLDEYKNFESRVKERAEKKYNYSAKTGKEYEMNNFISAFYDAVLLYAIALNETLAEGLDPRNGRNVTSKMWNRTFVGITGNVSIDQNGDRYSDYSLLDLDPQQDKFVEVAYYSGAQNQLRQMAEFHWVGGSPPKDSPICGWDHSNCRESNSFQYYVYLLLGIIIMFLFVGIVIFWRRWRLEKELAAMSWRIPYEELEGDDAERRERKKKRSRKVDLYDHPDQSEALLRSNSRVSITSDKFAEDDLDVLAMRMRLRSSSSGATRKISAMIDRKFSIFTRKKSSPSDKIVENNHSNHYEENNVNSPTNSVATSKKKSSNEEDYDNNTKKSICSRNRKFSFSRYSMKSGGSVETIQMQHNAQIFAKTSTYKGQIVAIKKLAIDPKRFPKIDMSRKVLMEFKALKDLQHDHIIRFAGACIECPNYCIVTEYCPKGSLEDILENEKIKLDKMMKYSLLHDLVKGMYFLHNSVIRSHGRLKTSNCVVDSRFVLKITDFGLSEIHKLEDVSAEALEEHSFFRKQLWTAPELLRMECRPYQGSQRGDVYSFALILHEMLYRHGAFYRGDDENPSPKDIIANVIRKPINEDVLYRPIIPEISPVDDNPETVKKLIDLMVSCWAENNQDRPEFSVIRKIVHSLNKDNETSNLVDNLLKRMEQYATNLEGLVEERTQEYLAEKKKVEELLHQLLPPTVADQLIAGHAVQAESYECVTIYFSDIVGFTALSSKSTPMQVVTLLNDLYLAFDGVVDNFKVYKVETIGDAYMVVSGLPERRDDHASQIAQMSLALLHKVKNFVIRHRPNEQLKLRIGMHSGQVVAGVVGSKMPRYTLFGDCVNTSSRMESNGLPLKIHVSKDTKAILSKDPDFQLELRGEIEMKGKGLQTTYWLKSYKDIIVPDFGPEFR